MEATRWDAGETLVSEGDPLTERILGCAIEVHKELGPGLLESTYEAALVVEFGLKGIRFRRQVAMPVFYKGHQIADHRLDLVVEDQVVVEIKSVERLDPVHTSQLLTYMRIARCRRGLLLNFNQRMLVDGVKRVVL